MACTRKHQARLLRLLLLALTACGRTVTPMTLDDARCLVQDCLAPATCSVRDDKAYCVCPDGMLPQGRGCIVAPDDGTGGEVTPSACLGIDCEAHGICQVIGNTAQCLCESGYANRDLTHCDSLCVPVTCSGHGTCTLSAEFLPVCSCDTNYELHDSNQCLPDSLGDECTTAEDCLGGDTCTVMSCDADNTCSLSFPTGPCDNGIYCDVNDHCDGAGACVGIPRDCGPPSGPCMVMTCNGTCAETQRPNGDLCDDNDPCTVATRCQAGACVGSPLDTDGDGQTSYSCGGTDCDDSDAAVHAGRNEGPAFDITCSDGVDNNCNSTSDALENDCKTSTAPMSVISSGPAMPFPLQDANLTPINDGRLAMIGGLNIAGPVSSSLYFDPLNNRWGQFTDMSTPRANHAVVLLRSGLILAAGGSSAGSATTSETLNPQNGTWTGAGPLATGRSHTPGILLENGVAALMLGKDTSDNGLKTTDLYQPESRTWSTAAAIATTGRFLPSIVREPDGTIVSVGGLSAWGVVSPKTDLFASSLLTASGTNPLNNPHGPSFGLFSLPTGTLLALGGHGATYPNAEICTLPGHTWSTATNPLVTYVADFAGARLPNGKILMAGGATQGGPPNHHASAYDASSDSWNEIGSLGSARRGIATAVLFDGRVLMAGGSNSTASPTTDTDLLHITTPAIVNDQSLTNPRAGHRTTLLLDGRIFTAGGDSVATTDSGETLDLHTRLWSPTPLMNSPHNNGTATLLMDGMVAVVGGKAGSNPVTSIDIFDPPTNTMNPGPVLGTPVHHHAATLLNDGRLLITGGMTAGGSPTHAAQLLDASHTSVVATTPMALHRAFHTATMTAAGDVLVTGGMTDAVTWTNTTEIYRPTAEQFFPGPNLGNGRSQATATLLYDNTVLVVGGQNSGDPIGSVDRVDIANTTNTAAANLLKARFNHAAILTLDGRVWVVGGEDEFGALSTTELFEPTTNTWRVGPRLPIPLIGPTLTMLPNGYILVVGGETGSTTRSPSANVSVFDEGRNALAAWKPELTNVPSKWSPASSLNFSGTQLVANFDTMMGSVGNHGSTNYPLILVRRLDNGATTLASVSNWSSTLVIGQLSGNMALGPALVVPITNGIAGNGGITTVDD